MRLMRMQTSLMRPRLHSPNRAAPVPSCAAPMAAPCPTTTVVCIVFQWAIKAAPRASVRRRRSWTRSLRRMIRQLARSPTRPTKTSPTRICQPRRPGPSRHMPAIPSPRHMPPRLARSKRLQACARRRRTASGTRTTQVRGRAPSLPTLRPSRHAPKAADCCPPQRAIPSKYGRYTHTCRVSSCVSAGLCKTPTTCHKTLRCTKPFRHSGVCRVPPPCHKDPRCGRAAGHSGICRILEADPVFVDKSLVAPGRFKVSAAQPSASHHTHAVLVRPALAMISAHQSVWRRRMHLWRRRPRRGSRSGRQTGRRLRVTRKSARRPLPITTIYQTG